jgi:hypothetical protein
MSYRSEKLVEFAIDLVRQHPRLTAAEARDGLRVHRHTLQHALRANGLSFASIKQALVLDRLDDRFAVRATSLKQVHVSKLKGESMKKPIQRLVVSSLLVLSVGTMGAIITEVSTGSLYAVSCPNCGSDGSCPGSPAGACYCPPVTRGKCQVSVQ